MAQSNDFTQSELMSTESGEPSFSVAKVDSPILRISNATFCCEIFGLKLMILVQLLVETI